MSKTIMRKLWNNANEEDKTCPICYETIKTFDSSFITNCCANMFHINCILKSVYYNNDNCPMCKTVIRDHAVVDGLEKVDFGSFLENKEEFSKITEISIQEFAKIGNYYNESFKEQFDYLFVDVIFNKDDTDVLKRLRLLIETETKCKIESHSKTDRETDSDSETDSDYITESESSYREHQLQEDHEPLINEHELAGSFCDCECCEKVTNIQRIKISIIDDNCKNFFELLNEFCNFYVNTIRFDNLTEILIFIIKNDSYDILEELIFEDYINSHLIEEIPEIYNEFIECLRNDKYEIAKLLIDHFAITVEKVIIDELVSNSENEQFYNYFIEKCILKENVYYTKN
jgi:hypothetical protein